MLSDPQHRVIDIYGLQDPRYLKLNREGIPYPAVLLIDKSGKIAWMKIEKDYTQHFTNSEIRAALNALK